MADDIFSRPEAIPARGPDLYAGMKAEITSLRFPPGTQLQEVALGQRFGVSRTPVREALQRLLRDGLVERFGRFYRVIRLTETEVRELCELREALECMAVELAVVRQPGCTGRLSALIAAQEAALGREDFDAFNDLDGEFHLRIGQAAGNTALLRQVETLRDKACLVRGMEQRRPHWTGRVIAEHRRIVNAMERRDAAIAAAEMRYHIRSVIALRPPA
ncbi:GntR family transcriptional regulator [Roseomonas sp. M0104]|uniref:GntR family transcriptional regulator n=1 Tax=Teichococcus coralli TaxID=2545983 RepID=A0A845B8A1_9PROT|nr:GntR family transcriptional regulator [Pseudoroseomonas coralli]MXP62470.1 GntR family transcriptional regulator [Pseudoroseomonas coralli]